jgi:Rad3-related DNA helicase
MSSAVVAGAVAPVIRLAVAGDRIDEIFSANGLLAKQAREQGFPYELREGQVQLPRALMQLRQGFGRLIRTRSDWGVVVILDERVVSRSWGGAVFSSLPKGTKRLTTVSQVEAFFASMRPGGAT